MDASSAFAPKADGYDLNEARMESVFIGISGLIGAGKTTLAVALAKKLNLPVYYEPVIDNAYLQDFYADMARYSFPLQVYLLNRRFAQQQQIIWSGKGGVQDRTIYEDAVFAKMLKNAGLMDARDYDTYITLFNHMSNFMKKPNIIIHLDVTPEESLRRIKMRSRGCETGITLEYLTQLREAYEEFIKNISLVIPVIKVNWSDFRSADEMAEKIRVEYAKLHNIRYVDFGSSPKAPAGSEESKAAGSGVKLAMSAPRSKLTRVVTPPRAPATKYDHDSNIASPPEKKAAPGPSPSAAAGSSAQQAVGSSTQRKRPVITARAAAAQLG